MFTISPFVILTVLIIILTCLEAYHQYATSKQKSFSFKPVIPFMKQTNTVLPPPILEHFIDDTCKLVDFQWLASDRTYWDGWLSKSMFINKDGRFTRQTVNILEKETVCVVVLLGPIPALASIKPEMHYAPPDIIVMTAKGDSGSTTSIRLAQHPKQLNVYFAAVQFPYNDRYYLEGSVEYRSYFYEQPGFHRPNKVMMTGSNELIVSKSNTFQDLKPCRHHLQGIWMKKSQLQQRDPVRYYSEFRNTLDFKSDSVPVFVPHQCELRHAEQEKCLNSKTIHAFGDVHLKRNIQSLKGSIAWCDVNAKACMCDEMKDQITINKPLELTANTKIHFRNVDSIVHNLDDWKFEMTSVAHRLPKADIIILGIGNEDLIKPRQSPNDFATTFNSFIHFLIQQVYLTETIIIRTPQYVGLSKMKGAWNAGRSEAYANIVRSSVANLPPQWKSRVILWDTHQLGGAGGVGSGAPTCKTTTFSNRHLVEMENKLLLTLICNHPFT